MPTTHTPHLWQVGVYLRLSKEDARRESASIANQRAILLDYLNHEFQDPWTLTQVYTDDGRTGTDDSRPAFQSLIRDIERGKVNCVLCKTLSRAFRNYADQGYYLEEFFPEVCSNSLLSSVQSIYGPPHWIFLWDDRRHQ